MIELAEIFAEHGPAYREKFKGRIPANHLKAMADIEQCRTAALGGQVYVCDECGENYYRYHSCKNRHCPKCQNDAAQAWLARQSELLLPLPYFIRRTIFLWSPSPSRRDCVAWPAVIRN